ncbi:MAG: hypothetical protein U5K30_14075 [Acidimicrobiales bacterium]|nr:hypothetical protein [Acidimicrobiales bacterium]
MYGAKWLTAGMGSVFLLWGDAGDKAITTRHLKPIYEKATPMDLKVNHGDGWLDVISVQQQDMDAATLLAKAGSSGVTAGAVAKALFGDTSRNAKQKARDAWPVLSRTARQRC